MFKFTVTKKSKKSRARLGVLHTDHGDVQTPCLVTVATQATVKALTRELAEKSGARLLICNTYHLHLKPGEAVIKAAGGLHRFMNWPHPLMTDSGGFQVFSLGFGRDHGMGKLLKSHSDAVVNRRSKPSWLKINENGVEFRSTVDGRKLFIGPKESMHVQGALGADIGFAFDECTSPVADHEYTAASLERTHRWAKLSLRHRRRQQALYGVVQGGRFEDLRRASARVIGAMPFDGFGIGGEFGDDKSRMAEMIRWVVDELPADKPRHLLGIGHPDDFLPIIKEGVDTFDCTIPTHYARHGTAFTSTGRLDLQRSVFLRDRSPLDRRCGCFVCAEHSRAYLSHLLRAKEMLAATLLTCHNLYFFHEQVRRLREDVRAGKL